MFLMRVALSDVPGALGAVATALGGQGVDIEAVQIVGRDGDTVFDDFLVDIPTGRLPDQIVSACQALDGVRVEWIAYYPEGGTLESDLEALDLITRNPARGAQTLTSSAISVFRVSWAVLVEGCSRTPTATHRTDQAPELSTAQLTALGAWEVGTVTPDDDWLPGWQDVIIAKAPVAGDRAVILGRQGGPRFLPSELARFGHLAALVPLGPE